MNFSQALVKIKEGKTVGRRGWKNARGVFLVEGSRFNVSRAPLNKIYPEGTRIQYLPHIDMLDSKGRIGTWSPSMVDIMANDWRILKKNNK